MSLMKMTCIVCPIGCRLEIERDGDAGEITKITGNNCPRGVKYARDELFNPVRTLTTTVSIDSETTRCLPVKTDNPIPKDRLMAAMDIIAAVKCRAPVAMGDIIAADISPGVNLVACKSVRR